MIIKGVDFVGKCALEDSQLDNISKYFDRYEIQLLPVDMLSTIEDLAKKATYDFDALEVVSVHTSLGRKYPTEVTLELLDNPRGFEEVKHAFALANAIGKKYKRTISVILHFLSDYEMWQSYCSIADSVMHKVFKLLTMYPYTEVAIENMVPYHTIKDNRLDSNKYEDRRLFNIGAVNMDNIQLARYYISQAPNSLKGRIKTTIDTCHIKMCVDFAKHNHPEIKVSEVEDYFRYGGDICNIVHLATCRGTGLHPDEHGVGFLPTEEDMVYLTRCLKSIKTYAPQAKVVLEIAEDDYSLDTSFNKRETLKLIKDEVDY